LSFIFYLGVLLKSINFFADRYYTVDSLITYLLTRGIYYTGTGNINRRNAPQQLKTLSLQHQEARWFRNIDSSQLCVAWRDKQIKKPSIVVSSNTAVVMVQITTWCNQMVKKPKLTTGTIYQ
jgi:hypothetical protein